MTVTRSVQILQEKGNAMPIKEAIRTQRMPVRIWGCKPEPPKFPSSQLQPRHECVQVDHLAVALEGVMPVQQDVPPGRR